MVFFDPVFQPDVAHRVAQWTRSGVSSQSRAGLATPSPAGLLIRPAWPLCACPPSRSARKSHSGFDVRLVTVAALYT
jgi:hypothetical protein